MTRAHAFRPADGREAVLWDSTAPGLGLRAQPSGHKSWIVHRRCNGSVIRRTLGPLEALTVEDARHAARAVIAEAEAGDDGPHGAGVRTGIPRRLRGEVEARDAGELRGHNTALDTARVRQPPGRCDQREGRAHMARRHHGHGSRFGELGAGGAVIADEARRDTGASAGGLQPLPGPSAAQDRLLGSLPDRRRARRSRASAR